ncbi:hsp90-like protein [Panaeolus papilionaceus]|nr:hsp90-like protein [Panaeolus papilionaceus]
MPLNYSKWDQLELSDDSDIEGHPNVDKKSLIRWKQRDIHEKREARKHKIAHLNAQIACNEVLLPRIKEIHEKLSSSDAPTTTAYFSSLVDKLQTNPSKDCPPGNDPSKLEQTYDGMLISLLKMVSEKSRDKVKEAGTLESEKTDRLAKELNAEMAFHVKNLADTIAGHKKEVAVEIGEQQKHITMDDLHDGFESKYVPPPPAPAPLVKGKGKEKENEKIKEKATTIEVLNPKSSSSIAQPATSTNDDDEEEDELPQMTPNLLAFSKLPLYDYEKSFEFIQHHRDVYVPGASDALLVAAFTAEGEGKHKYAKQCVCQSLLIQYCEKLGKDGVGIFFKKMVNGEKRALKVFQDDVDNTYQHIVNRVKASQEEAQSGREQIQLVPENPEQTISFNVPDGPPPEELVLEGPGTEGLDIEEVRKALQFRWDVFQGFSPELQAALKDGGLDGVNKVLGEMSVDEAEGIVHSLDVAGILNFADGGIRDATGQE